MELKQCKRKHAKTTIKLSAETNIDMDKGSNTKSLHKELAKQNALLTTLLKGKQGL